MRVRALGALAFISISIATASVRAADSCYADKLEKVQLRAYSEIENRAIKAEASELGRAQKRIQEDARAANQKKRIEWALARSSDKSEMAPSEIREIKKAAEDLKAASRENEWNTLTRRLQRQEGARLKRSPLTGAERALIDDKVIWSDLAGRQELHLPKGAIERLEGEILLDLAKNPLTAGKRYLSAGDGTIDGYPLNSFYKIPFYRKPEIRLIYRIDEQGRAVIETIGSRENVYSGKFRRLGGVY